MHERRFSGDIGRLRSTERVERLEVGRVIEACLEHGSLRSVLDAGTGSGLFAEGFSRHGLQVTGMDANFEMLPVARGYVPNGRFTQALVEALPFRQGAFDLVFYGLVLHEADDPVAVLWSARQVSKKRVCILEWPYREQPFGPPISDRLNPDDLATLFEKGGYLRWDSKDLTNTVLYLLEV